MLLGHNKLGFTLKVGDLGNDYYNIRCNFYCKTQLFSDVHLYICKCYEHFAFQTM